MSETFKVVPGPSPMDIRSALEEKLTEKLQDMEMRDAVEYLNLDMDMIVEQAIEARIKQLSETQLIKLL